MQWKWSAINSPRKSCVVLALNLVHKSQAQVIQYSKTGDAKVYQFNGIFPQNIAAIGVDWNNVDDIERFDAF